MSWLFFISAIALAAGDVGYPDHVYGIDVSTSVSADHFSCLKKDNLTFAIIRCYHSYGAPDDNAPATVKNAHTAGLDGVDVYMFPCPTCGNPSKQVTDAVNYLKQNNAPFGTFWFDIEGSQYWTLGQSKNRDFFSGLLKEGETLNLKMGVYTSKSQWDPIMGSWDGGKSLPLWYAHYDGIPDFTDFAAFGGWTKPHMKQFSDKGAKCSVSYDIDWYPPS